MQKPQIMAHFCVPADQHAPAAIHPTMRALPHPPPGFEANLVLQRVGLLAPCLDMSCEPKFVQQAPDLIVVIAFVQAHPLRSLCGGLRPLHRNTLDGLPSHLESIAIRPGHGEPDRYAAGVGEEAAFGTALPTVCGVLAHLLPPQGGLGSWPHPWRATPNRCPARHHIPPALAPIRRPRRLPLSILGSVDGRHCGSRARWHPALPPGSRCAVQRKWHPWPYDHHREADGTPGDVVGVAGAAG